MLSFAKHLPNVFQSGGIVLHSHQQWMRVPVAPDPCQYLLLSVFWILAILIGRWWYLTYLMCLTASVIWDSLKSWCWTSFHVLICRLFSSFTHLKYWVVCFLFIELNSECYLHILNSLLLGESFANIFTQSLACIFILLMLSFADQKF